MKGIMLQGTSSDVGKSYLTTAICRILHKQGLKVAPFKSPNMSNNSYVTVDGKEIGRAQGVQAEAAGIQASVYMNPILLKPRNDLHSEVVFLGESYQTFSGKDYRDHFFHQGLDVIEQSIRILEKEFDYIVIEGLNNVLIDGEDSLSWKEKKGKGKTTDLAVVKLPYVSNYTDLDPFQFDEDVSVRFVREEKGLAPWSVNAVSEIKEVMFDRLAEEVEMEVDMGALLSFIEQWGESHAK